jgi:hypothetical protein
MAKLERELDVMREENERLYGERGRLFEAVNNQDRALQTLKEAHRTISIMAKSLGEAILSDGDRSDIVKILAAGLVDVDVDTSAETSEPIPKESWEDD